MDVLIVRTAVGRRIANLGVGWVIATEPSTEKSLQLADAM
jgi:hypothetical protein